MQFIQGDTIKDVYLLVTTAPFKYEEQQLVLVILEDISELTALRGIIPMCASCKKIRDDEQYWHRVEKYFSDHLEIKFSHGLCPDCAHKLYPEYFPTTELAEEGSNL